MKHMQSKILAGLLGIVLCAGCSVKEDRGGCPCRLVLDFSKVDTASVRAADLMVRSDGFVLDEKLHAGDFRDYLTFDVPRDRLEVWLSGGTEGLMTDAGLFIPSGEDCPPVYLHFSEVDAGGETVREEVLMKKNHCVMTINLNNSESDPLGMTVIGNINGYMADGSPSYGEFHYDVPLEGSVGNKAVLPRQVDNSLVVEVCDGMGIVRRFPVGEYIYESGYDWNEPDLKDITLDIDIAVTEVRLVIEGWDVIYEFDVII